MDEIQTLKGQEAIDLWQQGRDVWNEWVAANPKYNVDFQKVDFGELTSNSTVSFSEFNFPDGNVSFIDAQFGKGEVSFNRAQFGEGDLNFDGAKFGKGRVGFYGAKFGEGEVSFWETQFGEGDVSFNRAQFGEGDVSFYGAKFGEGEVSFWETQFGEGEVSFSRAEFGKGKVSFYGAKFGEGEVSFWETQFGEGEVCFWKTQFGEGEVSFDKAEFGKGDVRFTRAQFGEGYVSFIDARFGKGNVSFLNTNFSKGDVDFRRTVFGEGDVNFTHAKSLASMQFINTVFGMGDYNFEYAEFGGNVMFTGMKNSREIEQFSLRYATFNKALAIDAPEGFNCVVDLVSTDLSCHLDMHNFTCTFEENGGYPMRVARDKRDIGRLQRLKELSENNRAHEKAIDYRIEEMQARRIHEHDNPLKYALEYLFWVSSNYGRSILVPCSWLLGSAVVLTLWFWLGHETATLSKVGECTLAYGIPLLATSKALMANPLCGELWSAWGHSLYSIASLLLIFLIGLGLRNRFRL